MSQTIRLSQHWAHPETGTEYRPGEVVTLDDRVAWRVTQGAYGYPTTGPDRRGYLTWYVNSDRENVDWSQVVVDGAAVQRIYELRVWTQGTDAEQWLLWAGLGAAVPPERVLDAQADGETTTPPPSIIPFDGEINEGPTAFSLPIVPGEGIHLEIVDDELVITSTVVVPPPPDLTPYATKAALAVVTAAAGAAQSAAASAQTAAASALAGAQSAQSAASSAQGTATNALSAATAAVAAVDAVRRAIAALVERADATEARLAVIEERLAGGADYQPPATTSTGRIPARIGAHL